jgi:hypothetical protein
MKATSKPRTMAIALGLLTALASSPLAYAQAPAGQGGPYPTPAYLNGEPYMLMVLPNGATTQMPVDKAMVTEAMKSSKPLTGPIMITVSAGKAYMTSDMKMADGKMLYDAFAQHAKQDIDRTRHEY